ncbi:hypothetical protein BT63DRAFT_425289 [Microthyrium microscopicum]|uniref:Cation chloride cotransporter n=1 Tax=Microthyrium microscopicum TaxID=703497 RepID=A0A6A6UBV2_9PEZI|nr:hypothetical protein BT63DRAFT_425289 [Microthyrium microscopicum]
MAPKKDAASKKAKLGTFTGVFIPTSLNVFSILMFLRFGFILGQVGILGFFGMLIACYSIDLLTFTSISAIATNGAVKGGGAYYLISRSLGPEFGGAIGVMFYIGTSLNSGMNSVGLIKALVYNFGLKNGNWVNVMPDTYWWSYLWATCVLLVATGICMAGSSLFARAGNLLFVIIVIATYSIPLSALLVKPFENSKAGVVYTGFKYETFKSNLYPAFTSGADGSNIEGKENWQSLFGVLFPATAGIFAGASMSGDLKNPGKSIPRGTIGGMVLTFFTYILLITCMGSTIKRESFYHDSNIVQDTNIAGIVILVGELSVTFFGALLGVIGSAKMLQALARDSLLPGLGIFGRGSKRNDEPHYAILLTYLIAQCAMLLDLNQIAGLVAMSILLTFVVTNLACFLLKIGSAPNFRPSFRYFSWPTAALGALISAAVMVFVDGTYALAALIAMTVLFTIIHYASPPKAWGDVSQSLIYHQVRKYLLRLRQDHVKFWRPSILLLINDPRSSFKLVQFCNSLKKGALFILGHVIVNDDFRSATSETKKQLASWNKYIDFSQIKAFTNITVSPKIEWGIRNLVLTAGLGGMRPNIVIMSFFNLEELRKQQPLIQVPSPQPSRPVSRRNSSQKMTTMWNNKMKKGALPTDADRREGSISPQSYVTLLEDLLHGVHINVAITKGFEKLNLPDPAPGFGQKLGSWFRPFKPKQDDADLTYIDLWPIQMSSFTQIESEDGKEKKSILTSNFDTYTLILQLGSILESVEAWGLAYKLRVSVFVEYETEIEEERKRVHSLLDNLRIHATVRVFHLAAGNLATYEAIVNGHIHEPEYASTMTVINDVLADEAWWADVQEARANDIPSANLRDLVDLDSASLGTPDWRRMPLPKNVEPSQISVGRLRKLMARMKKGVGHLDRFHPAMRVKLSHLDQQLIDHYAPSSVASDMSSDDSDAEDTASSIHVSSSQASSSTHQPDVPQSRRGDVHAVESFLSHPRRTATFSRAPSSSNLSRPIAISSSPYTSNLTYMPPESPRGRGFSRSSATTPRIGSPSSTGTSPYRRSFAMRTSSLPKFTSSVVPPTKINTDDDDTPGAGPSISFADLSETAAADEDTIQPSELTALLSPSTPPPPPILPSQAAHTVPSQSEPTQATGFPFTASQPLSFNDLPARAQNLILNELLASNSHDASVVFTTLPSPADGTGAKEEESVRYLGDLEVLCQGLPPVVLVHCKSVTVTVSL